MIQLFKEKFLIERHLYNVHLFQFLEYIITHLLKVKQILCVFQIPKIIIKCKCYLFPYVLAILIIPIFLGSIFI